MKRVSVVLGLAVLVAAAACSSGDAVPLTVDAAVLDGNVDGGPSVDAGSCVLEAPPAPVAGRCTSSIVDPTAGAPTGPDGMGGLVTPDGRRVRRVGRFVELPGFPMKLVPVPGTRFVLVTDGGVEDEQLSVVDLDSGAVVGAVTFPENGPMRGALFLGLVVSADGRRVWASGGGTERIYALDLDVATGALTSAPADDLVIVSAGSDEYVADIALLPDGTTLVANLLFGDALAVLDTTTGTETRRIPLGDRTYPFGLAVSADGATAFVSTWGEPTVVPVDLVAGAAGTPISVGKNPEGLTFSPDGSRVIVAASDSDSIAVIDVATRTVLETIYVQDESSPRGASPAAVAFDPSGRLYVVHAGDNAVEVLAPPAGAGARYTSLGRIPTTWYPTYVHVAGDGTVLILDGKHEGTGANLTPGATDILDLLGGALQIVPAADVTSEALAAWDMQVSDDNTRAAGFEAVTCPPGAAYDFPIPLPGGGPSTRIDHVVVVVRENKTHDAYFGNLLGTDGLPHGNGDPTLTILPPGEMDSVLPNTRQLAREFTMGDNYYSGAEQSIQGHIWTTLGRTTDFVERSWLTTWGRSYWTIPPQGTFAMGYPEEGSIFDYLVDHGVTVGNYGEIVSSRAAAPMRGYPGLVYAIGISDRAKADWLGEQWQGRCLMRTFSYVVMPRDHTQGLTPGAETPRSMIADNDDGVGWLVDRLSRSTYWPRTVVFVIEDDPQDGGDHVDNHRAPLLVISPWAKRGHVASVHYNESSIYRTIQLILGIDGPLNAYWANASPMYDAFTSTPDYTPYTHRARAWPVETNGDTRTFESEQSRRWDFSLPDAQPGLSRALWRHLRGSEPPWRVASPEPFEDD